MKRCPHCNRVESDAALVYYRADGTALISDSGSVSGDAGTVKFGAGGVSAEIETASCRTKRMQPSVAQRRRQLFFRQQRPQAQREI